MPTIVWGVTRLVVTQPEANALVDEGLIELCGAPHDFCEHVERPIYHPSVARGSAEARILEERFADRLASALTGRARREAHPEVIDAGPNDHARFTN